MRVTHGAVLPRDHAQRLSQRSRELGRRDATVTALPPPHVARLAAAAVKACLPLVSHYKTLNSSPDVFLSRSSPLRGAQTAHRMATSERGPSASPETLLSAAGQLNQPDGDATAQRLGSDGGGSGGASPGLYVSLGSPANGPGPAVYSPSTPLESPKASSHTPSSPKLQPADSARSLASGDGSVDVGGSEAGSSEASGSTGSSLSPHYDDKRDIILRLEFLRTPEVKVRCGAGACGRWSHRWHVPPSEGWYCSEHFVFAIRLACARGMRPHDSRGLEEGAVRCLLTQGPPTRTCAAHPLPPRAPLPCALQAIIRGVTATVAVGVAILIIALYMKLHAVSPWRVMRQACNRAGQTPLC